MKNRKVRLMFACLLWTFFLTPTLPPSLSYADSVDPTTAKILRDI